MTWVWGLLAAIALLWPGRLSGPLDGIPLDRSAEAVLFGLAFPALFWFHRSFLKSRPARALVVALLAWKAVTALTLVQDGWCVSVIPSRPYVADQTGLPHSWDVRADWRSPNPTCAAIMTRSYWQMDEFPVWFFNLPGADGGLPTAGDLPPEAVTRLTIAGTLTAPRAGVFRLAMTPNVMATASVDGAPASLSNTGATLAAGQHQVSIDATLTTNLWRFQTLWDGRDLWSGATATVAPPSTLDLLVRPWGRFVTTVLAASLLLGWMFSALARVRDVWTFAWLGAASAAMSLAGVFVPERRWQWCVAALAAASLLPLARRVRNIPGAFLLIGVPWIALVVFGTRYDIGRMTFYGPGNDWWMFQRYAYRIVLQGYWLEAGEKTFWFQPLYRWVAGLLHLVFGDSSVGEEYWNGACLTVMALFSFRVTKVFAGARWGLAAAALTLALFVAGPGFVFVQNGLSEVTSAGFIYLGALYALRSRSGSTSMAVAARICAVLGFYTRLNNFPMSCAVALFAWPITEPARTILRPAAWFRRASLRTIAILGVCVAAGLLFFAWRTYHYTGVFSLFRGTALDHERGTARLIWAHAPTAWAGIRGMFDNIIMVLTTMDPPRVHNGALPLIVAVVIALVAATGIGPLGSLPFGAVAFTLSALAGSLVARGTAYPGRFSIHIIGAAATVFVCALSQAVTFFRLRADAYAPGATSRKG